MIKLIICLQLCTSAAVSNKCSTPSIPRYHLIEKCHRSKLGIVARANFTSLTSCRRFGIEKRGLALNFMPQSMQKSLKTDEFSCEVLTCAEVEGGLSLSNDTRFDYYSIYANPIPNVNTTCVSAVGMFYLLEKQLNYTEAQNRCLNMKGVLAGVTSEQRTDALAQVLAAAGVTEAYVGMRKTNGSTFHTPNGNILECSTYRAWAPGHPRKKSDYNCALLTKQHTWRTTKCKTVFPSLCELIPNGPYKRRSIFTTRINDINVNKNKYNNQKTNGSYSSQ